MGVWFVRPSVHSFGSGWLEILQMMSYGRLTADGATASRVNNLHTDATTTHFHPRQQTIVQQQHKKILSAITYSSGPFCCCCNQSLIQRQSTSCSWSRSHHLPFLANVPSSRWTAGGIFFSFHYFSFSYSNSNIPRAIEHVHSAPMQLLFIFLSCHFLNYWFRPHRRLLVKISKLRPSKKIRKPRIRFRRKKNKKWTNKTTRKRKRRPEGQRKGEGERPGPGQRHKSTSNSAVQQMLLLLTQ